MDRGRRGVDSERRRRPIEVGRKFYRSEEQRTTTGNRAWLGGQRVSTDDAGTTRGKRWRNRRLRWSESTPVGARSVSLHDVVGTPRLYGHAERGWSVEHAQVCQGPELFHKSASRFF